MPKVNIKYILSDAKLSPALYLAHPMQGIPMKPIRQLAGMPKVIEFSNVHYVRLRTKVHKFLEEHPDIKILEITRSDSPWEPLKPITKTIKIVYEEG